MLNTLKFGRNPSFPGKTASREVRAPAPVKSRQLALLLFPRRFTSIPRPAEIIRVQDQSLPLLPDNIPSPESLLIGFSRHMASNSQGQSVDETNIRIQYTPAGNHDLYKKAQHKFYWQLF